MTTPGFRGRMALACTVALTVVAIPACGDGGGGGSAGDSVTIPKTATTSAASPQSTIAAAVTPTTTKPSTTPSNPITPTTQLEPAVNGYVPVEAPHVPSTSAPVTADNKRPDGVYYATVTEGGDPPPATGAVVFELVQLFVGADCTAYFGSTDPDACVNDYGVETDPTATIEIPLDRQYITVTDAATQQSYRISGAELYGLIHGDDPSAGAPDEYIYSGFGYLLTVVDGRVTRLEQWWTP